VSGLSSAANLVQLGLPTRDPFAQLGPLKYDNWKNGYIALTQPPADAYVRILQGGTTCLRERGGIVKKPLKVESKMADDAHIFNKRAPISLKRQTLDPSNLVCAPMTMSFDGMQDTKSNGTWPGLGDIDLN